MDIEYLGVPGEVAAPQVTLVDDRGRRFEETSAGVEIPNSTGQPTTQEDRKPFEDLTVWLFSTVPRKGRKPQVEKRKLETGEKYSVFFTFEDPKSTGINQLVFADVPPIALPPPKDKQVSN